MTDRIRSLARHVAVVATALLGACESDSTGPVTTQTDAARAAQTFSQLADSVTRTGGDADMGIAYSGIADILRMGGRITPIVLTIDGVASQFMAAAMTVETTINDCPKGAQCFAPPSILTNRSLIAWDKDNPKRIVQLSSTTNDEQIGAIFDPSPLALYARMASLIYMDGAGGTYIGTSGTQKFDVKVSDTPCPAPADSGKLLRPGVVGSCTLADHAVTFSGTAEPSPFVTTSTTAKGTTTTAKGTHTIAMSAQTVAGTRRAITINNVPCDTGCTKPTDSLPKPPVIVRPSNELPAKLSATVNGDVTLTFTVTNASKDAAKVVFPSSQKYDFVVIDSTSGKEAWRWSVGKGFTQTIVEQSLPAGGTLTFAEKWTPPSRGRYLARAVLTSTSHRAEAYAAVLVP